MATPEKNYGALLSDFLGSPQAMGLAQGLLSASRDQYGRPAPFGQAFGAGLLGMQQAEQAAADEKMKRQKMGLEERKFGLLEKEFALKEKAAQDALIAQQRQAEYLQQRLMGGGALAADEEMDQDKAQRAADALAMGDLKEAQKILLEKPEKVPGSIQMKQVQAENMEKTMAQLNPDDLVAYSGIARTFPQAGQAVLPEFAQSDTYRRYTQAHQTAELLARQIRAFLGDSVSPQVEERIEKMVNPSAWNLGPEQAKENYLQLEKLLKMEAETYNKATRKKRGAGSTQKAPSTTADPLGILED